MAAADHSSGLHPDHAPAHFRINNNANKYPPDHGDQHMKSTRPQRPPYRAIEPSWITLGQACLLILMAVLVQY